MAEPLRVVQVGAGSMGRGWLETIAANADLELVALVDLDADLARRAADEHGYPGLVVGTDLAQVLDAHRPDAVVNVTVPTAHAATTNTALAHGAAVLCEKPIADSVAAARSMVEAAQRSGRLLMISQSRRYGPQVEALRRLVERVGPVGTLACQFFRGPHFGGFRDEMAEPLLVDMAIHHFDLVRLLTGSDPVAVSALTYNPTWSWYRGNAAADATFTMADGSRFGYVGSWCAPGAEISWNGTWRVSGEGGTALWDGDHPPHAELADGTIPADEMGTEAEGIAGSLAEFVHCVRSGDRPDTAADRNIVSLAMVEAAIRSAAEQRIVTIEEVLGTS